MRRFKSGATRDDDNTKLDFEGFLSPLVIEAYGDYMHQHRIQSDGSLRDSDNWQAGIPFTAYIKSLFRHFIDLWFLHRGYERYDKKDGHKITKKEALCAILFNAQGYLHEEIKGEKNVQR